MPSFDKKKTKTFYDAKLIFWSFATLFWPHFLTRCQTKFCFRESMSALDQNGRIQSLGFLARWRLTSHALYYKILIKISILKGNWFIIWNDKNWQSYYRKIQEPKYVRNKECGLKLIFAIKIFWKICVSWHLKLTLKVWFWHFLIILCLYKYKIHYIQFF